MLVLMPTVLPTGLAASGYLDGKDGQGELEATYHFVRSVVTQNSNVTEGQEQSQTIRARLHS